MKDEKLEQSLLKEILHDFIDWLKVSVINFIKDYTKMVVVCLLNIGFVFLLSHLTDNQIIIYFSVFLFGILSLFIISVESLRRVKDELNWFKF